MGANTHRPHVFNIILGMVAVADRPHAFNYIIIIKCMGVVANRPHAFNIFFKKISFALGRSPAPTCLFFLFKLFPFCVGAVARPNVFVFVF